MLRFDSFASIVAVVVLVLELQNLTATATATVTATATATKTATAFRTLIQPTKNMTLEVVYTVFRTRWITFFSSESIRKLKT